MIPGECYLVGGALRDFLLGLSDKGKDKDWVIVGSSIEQMTKPQDGMKFQQVGKEFPVFLHPITKEEYALARKERKSSKGHTGFICDFTPDISLEDDLIRRDFTINAMAIKLEDINLDEDNNLIEINKNKIIDPYNGIKDIANKSIKHVSNAFIEDPLRVLRAFRFLARFKHLGFEIHGETINLIISMINKNQLSELSRPRVWQELIKALGERTPEIFFIGLQEINALEYIFKNLDFNKNIDFNLLKLAKGELNDFKIKSKNSDILFILSVFIIINYLHNNKNFALSNLDLPITRNISKLWNMLMRSLDDYKNLLNNGINNFKKKNNNKKIIAEHIVNLFYKFDIWRNPELLADILFLLGFALNYQKTQKDYLKFYKNNQKFNLMLLDIFNDFNKLWQSKNIDLSKIAKSGVKGLEMESYVRNKRIEIMIEIIN